jgi:hypothetical protein
MGTVLLAQKHSPRCQNHFTWYRIHRYSSTFSQNHEISRPEKFHKSNFLYKSWFFYCNYTRVCYVLLVENDCWSIGICSEVYVSRNHGSTVVCKHNYVTNTMLTFSFKKIKKRKIAWHFKFFSRNNSGLRQKKREWHILNFCFITMNFYTIKIYTCITKLDLLAHALLFWKCGSQLLVLHAFFYTLNILLALNEITQRWHRHPPLICAQF